MTHIFISYAQQDGDYARKLADHLLAAGFNIWRAAQNSGNAVIERTIDEAITRSAACLVLASSASQADAGVQRELAFARTQDRPIYVLMLSGRAWKQLAGLPREEARQGKLPPTAFLEKLGTHIAPTPDKARDLTPVILRGADAMPTDIDAGMTSLAKPAALRQLTDLLRTSMHSSSRDTTPKPPEKPSGES